MKIKSNSCSEHTLEIQNAPSQSAYSLLITDSAGNYLFAIDTTNRVKILTFEDGNTKEIESKEELTRAFVASILAICCLKPEYRSELKDSEKRKVIKLLREAIEELG